MRSLGERSDRDLIFRQALLNSKPVAGQDSLFASAVIDRKKNEIIVKIVNSASVEKTTTLDIEGAANSLTVGTQTVLTGSPDQMNTLDAPFTVAPVVSPLKLKGKKLDIVLKPFSFTVIKLAK